MAELTAQKNAQAHSAETLHKQIRLLPFASKRIPWKKKLSVLHEQAHFKLTGDEQIEACADTQKKTGCIQFILWNWRRWEKCARHTESD